MADPEIKIKVALDSPKDPWAEYKQKVKEAEAATRSLFAGTFKDAQERDAAIDSLGDKLDDLVSEGFELEKAFKNIGFTPEQKSDFETIVSMLENANKQFQIALNNRERLMQPIEEPDQPFVTGFGWENSPETTKFRELYASMSSSLSEYKTQVTESIAANEQLKATLEAEYAALDASSSGYAERKKLLESLLSASDSFAVSSETQRQTIEKQSEALAKLNEETENTGRYEENLQSIEQLNDKVVTSGLKVQKALRTQQGIAERYSTEMANLQQKELQQQQKKQEALEKELQKQQQLQSILEVQGKTYEELVQLFNELTTARANATTKEELTAIDANLTAVRKNIELTSREAQLSGARIIGSQTSIQGVFSSTLRLWQRGTLTLKGLTQGMKMFAKSTVFLAAIQLAWELLTNVWEKAKEALFGTADAAEAAAEKQQKLADAAKAASDNLINAQTALAAAREDEARQKAAQDLVNTIKAQNDYYKDQIKLVNEATAAQLRQLAVTSKEDERQLALDKLALQQELMMGKIDEYEYQERLIHLDDEAVQKKFEAATQQKKIEKDAAQRKLNEAEKSLKTAKSTKEIDMTGFKMTPEDIKAYIADVEFNENQIQQLMPQYAPLFAAVEEARERLKKRRTVKNVQALREAEDALAPIQWLIDSYTASKIDSFLSIPEYVRRLGLNENSVQQYTKVRNDKMAQKTERQTQINNAQKEADKAREAYDKAEREYNNAAEDNADAAVHAARVSQQRIEMNRYNEHNAKKNAENEKRIQAARDKVNGMEYAELKEEEKRLLAEAAKVGDRTPEGKRLAALAGVYTTERRSRDVDARRAKENVMLTGRDATGREAEVIAMAGKVTAQAVRNGAVDFDKALEVIKAAIDTKGTADNVAVLNMLKTLDGLMTTIQRESKKAKDLAKQTERLKTKMSKQ